MKIFNFNSKGGKVISVREWLDVDSPKGLVLIAHGMAEHSGRYDYFARRLNARGYAVIAPDHRAHGSTDKATPGYSDGDIYSLTVEDLHRIAVYYGEEYGLKVSYFGHSYGSFLGQRFIELHGEDIACAVLGGSSKMGNALLGAGKLVAGTCCLLGKAKKPGQLLKKITFDAYNKKFSEGTFISSLTAECDRYEADADCGFVCSYAFYKYFFGGVMKANKRGNCKQIPRGLPILLIAGKCDPVGEMGAGVEKLKAHYGKYVNTVEIKLYEGVRHEYHNDICRDEAIDDVADFLDKNVK